jgi:hypothetical protein
MSTFFIIAAAVAALILTPCLRVSGLIARREEEQKHGTARNEKQD